MTVLLLYVEYLIAVLLCQLVIVESATSALILTCASLHHHYSNAMVPSRRLHGEGGVARLGRRGGHLLRANHEAFLAVSTLTIFTWQIQLGTTSNILVAKRLQTHKKNLKL